LRFKNKNIIDTKFLYYFLNRNRQLLKYDNGVDQTNLKKNEILSVNIPIIPLKEQKRIVAILDRFDALCNDLTTGLPAEIEARQSNMNITEINCYLSRR
jgi:type I restriction enzyme S subunit